MLKGTLILVLAYVAAVYCSATLNANTEAFDPCICGGVNICI